MSANMCAWEPTLDLVPGRADFEQRYNTLCEEEPKPASPAMRRFVGTLLAKYPDLSDDGRDTIWADWPIIGDVNGRFVNLSIVWSRYAEGRAFFIKTAAAQGIDAYDPQDGKFFPVRRNHLALGPTALLAVCGCDAPLSRRQALLAAIVVPLSAYI